MRWWYTAKRKLMGILVNVLLLLVATAVNVGLRFTDDSQIWGGMVFLGVSSMSVLGIICVWRWKFSTRNWKYVTSDDKRAAGIRYFDRCTKMPREWMVERQETGQFYALDLGRKHTIKSVHFDCGETSDNPREVNIYFSNKDGGQPLTQITGAPYIKLSSWGDTSRDTTKVALDKPLKARKILMTVIIPDTNYPWRVNAVYVTVTGLRGLIHYTMGKVLFDHL